MKQNTYSQIELITKTIWKRKRKNPKENTSETSNDEHWSSKHEELYKYLESKN